MSTATQPTRRRRRWLLAPFALLLLVVGFVLVQVRPWHQVPVPPDSASPGEVVRAYSEASEAHDLATMRAVSVDDSDVPSWSDVIFGWDTEYRDMAIRPETRWRKEGTEAEGWRQATYVPVEMTVGNGPSDGFSDGRQPWGYILVRNSDDETWRIVDQGVV